MNENFDYTYCEENPMECFDHPNVQMLISDLKLSPRLIVDLYISPVTMSVITNRYKPNSIAKQTLIDMMQRLDDISVY